MKFSRDQGYMFLRSSGRPSITNLSSHQPRSQDPLSTSRKYPGCGWSRVYVYKSNPHRGWIIDSILSTLSMEVKVALLLYLES